MAPIFTRLAPIIVLVVGVASIEVYALSADTHQVALATGIAAATAIFSLVGLGATVRLMTALGEEQKSRTSILLGMSLFKLPVVGVGLYFGIQLAAGNLWLFAGTLVWVYLCAVWFLVANRN